MKKYKLIYLRFQTLVGIKSPVYKTGKKPDWDWTRPEKTDETELVWTGLAWFELDLCSPCKYASFATILKKNGQELHVLQPKQYVTIKSDLHNNL